MLCVLTGMTIRLDPKTASMTSGMSSLQKQIYPMVRISMMPNMHGDHDYQPTMLMSMNESERTDLIQITIPSPILMTSFDSISCHNTTDCNIIIEREVAKKIRRCLDIFCDDMAGVIASFIPIKATPTWTVDMQGKQIPSHNKPFFNTLKPLRLLINHTANPAVIPISRRIGMVCLGLFRPCASGLEACEHPGGPRPFVRLGGGRISLDEMPMRSGCETFHTNNKIELGPTWVEDAWTYDTDQTDLVLPVPPGMVMQVILFEQYQQQIYKPSANTYLRHAS